MPKLGIVTDFTAQFTKAAFPGKQFIAVIPGTVHMNQRLVDDIEFLDPSSFPASVNDSICPQITPPSTDMYASMFNELLSKFSELICILPSSRLFKCYENASQACAHSSCRNRIRVLDASVFGVGLGYLVQLAAGIASSGGDLELIEQTIRKMSSKIYSLYCFSSPSYLYYSGVLEKNQAIISEMLGLSPVYTLEEGALTPIRKEKNSRNVYEGFQEFLDEFENLKLVCYQRCYLAPTLEETSFLQFCKSRYKKPIFEELTISKQLALLFGPTMQGITVVEPEN